jgi:hypothetical protein
MKSSLHGFSYEKHDNLFTKLGPILQAIRDPLPGRSHQINQGPRVAEEIARLCNVYAAHNGGRGSTTVNDIWPKGDPLI